MSATETHTSGADQPAAPVFRLLVIKRMNDWAFVLPP